eukprot:TRINITY_DN3716_c0_g8_i1.p1 TRINITY_DN3716_c0_g8~~TRINITY_DN3716_c0_g8_i1.p1  ORF type:complete len:1250 (+),score=279.39 TRINITY_DN3716_c0_g8_i1:677-4426(+)
MITFLSKTFSLLQFLYFIETQREHNMSDPTSPSKLPDEDVEVRDEEDIALPASGSHFMSEHREEVLTILNEIIEGGEKAHEAGTLRYNRVKEILETYQEQGQLLRTVLPEFAALIVKAFWKRAQDDKEEVLQRFGSAEVSDILKCKAEFEEDDDPRTYLHEIAVLAYVLGKVVGPKNLISHLPHDVRQFEYAFYYLIWSTATHAQRTWEIRYLLLLWMTNTVLVPFDIKSIDSGLHDNLSLEDLLLEVAQFCLTRPGKVREVGAIFVGRLLTRPDMARSQHLPKFLKWCEGCLQPTDDETEVFRQAGALSAIASLMKFGRREELAPHLGIISDMLTQEHLTELNNMLLSKMLVKSVQRLGLAYLKPRVVSWRYQRGMRSLLDNLKGGQQQQQQQQAQEEQEEEEDDTAPEEVEPVLGVVLESLKNQDSIVRWSAAKGVGRLTARLAKEDADDVVVAVIETFDLYEDSNAWHGGCLALAELARRGLLLPSLIEQVIPITLKALKYEVVKGSYSVGRHVRDAGCYVCWAFARAYAPSDIATYAEKMSASLLSTALYDKEISVRRAAAAAFQECIGRLGNFPHGIDIVTRADYFTLSNRKRAYLEVSPVIAAYDKAYHNHFAEHLANNRLQHSDRDVRQLAAEVLGKLSTSDDCDGDIVTTHINSLLKRSLTVGSVDSRHGSILGVAEIVLQSLDKMSPETKTLIVNLMPTLEQSRLYRGRGGEHVRIAICRLIENMASAGMELPVALEVNTVKGKKKVKALGRYQECLDEMLIQTNESVQLAASRAFGAFSKRYFQSFDENFHGKITSKLLNLLTTTNLPNERRGAALALGLMPYFKETHHQVVEKLLQNIPVEEDPECRDAESRRNACTAVAAIALREESPSMELIEKIFTTLETASVDYTIDQRGDVGSLVRVAAMNGATTLALGMHSSGILTEGHFIRLLQFLLRQSTEKLDRVRSVAGSLLSSIVNTDLLNLITDSSLKQLLITFQQQSKSVEDWGAPLDTYCVIVPLLEAEQLYESILYGLVVASGGMSVHVSRPAFESLTEFMQKYPQHLHRMLSSITGMLTDNSGCERVLLPLLGTVEKLQSMQLFPETAAAAFSKALRAELRKSAKEIHIILQSVEVLCGLLTILATSGTDGEEMNCLLHCLLLLIAGRFPKVRAKVGSSLQTSLLVCPQLGGENNDSAQVVLCESVWDAPSAELVRSNRDKLYPLFGLVKPARTAAAQPAPKPKYLPDENANYSALVRDAGY